MRAVVKKVGIEVVSALGFRLPSSRLRALLCNHVVPRLMDKRVLATGLVERRTRRFPVNVLCDPYVFVHRHGYWCGMFFEEELEDYLVRELEPGDTVIDVGMNVGHVTIPAAAIVGARGQVLSFEPNTRLAIQVEQCAARQNLGQVRIFPFGLGSQPGSFTLRMGPHHAGGATLRSLGDKSSFSEEMICEVRVGDDALADSPLRGRVFLKMDVEGFELEALSGLRNTLERVDHAVIEVSPEWLLTAGVHRLFDIMARAGLHAHTLVKGGRVGPPVAAVAVLAQSNIVFVRGHTESGATSRA